ncbi:MAG: amidohydrolase family protein [Planctomycetota bacterium]|nr:amidohydrolase family protein [Planctomycetota bacterium]
MKIISHLILTLIVGANLAAQESDASYLAIVGGDIHTVTDGVIMKGVVLCKDSRILKVGKRVRIPEGAEIIDASGMQVYPGLIAADANSIVNGRGLSVADSYDPYSLNVDLALAGGITTIQNGGMVVKLKRGTIDDVLAGPTNWTNLNYSSTSPAGRRKLREEFSKVRDFMREHRAWELAGSLGEEAGEEPEPEGIKSEYLSLLKGEATAKFSANTLKDLMATCELLEEYPMQSVIVGGQEAWACAGRLGRVNARLIITPRSKKWASEDLNRPSGWTIENARTLWEHGVKFAILPQENYISLMGLAGRDLMTLPMEAAFAIRGGLQQQAALRAITIDAAEILGVDHRMGSIEVGKDANLIVCDGDLFHYRTFVQWAVVDGKLMYDKQKSTYFSHIRPREEEVIVDESEEVTNIDAPEVGDSTESQ